MQPAVTNLCTFHRKAVIACNVGARPECTLVIELCTAYVMMNLVCLFSDNDIYIYIDHVRNEEVLLRIKKQRNILHAISKRKAN